MQHTNASQFNSSSLRYPYLSSLFFTLTYSDPLFVCVDHFMKPGGQKSKITLRFPYTYVTLKRSRYVFTTHTVNCTRKLFILFLLCYIFDVSCFFECSQSETFQFFIFIVIFGSSHATQQLVREKRKIRFIVKKVLCSHLFFTTRCERIIKKNS